MYIIEADHIITCNDRFNVLQNKAIVFDKKILDIGDFNDLCNKYPKAIALKKEKHSVILPGLINTHAHLEFSSNTTQLSYGNFLEWLYSVIYNRNNIIKQSTPRIISDNIKAMIKSGTTSIGAISSYGEDLKSLNASKLRVVYFNEVIGSQKSSIKNAFDDMKTRFHKSLKHKSDTFTPAIAIHSPYSIHFSLLKKVVKFIKKNNLLSSAHFLESPHERKWLEHSKGGFKKFFKKFFKNTKSTMGINTFLHKTSSLPHILLTHNNYIKKKEFKFLLKKKNRIFISHCPVSNRLLGSKKANFHYLKKLNSSIGTDGLSSNISLSLFDELRLALFTHNKTNIHKLSKNLLLFATKNGAKALGIDSGEIKIGKNADIIVATLPDVCAKKEVALHTILHTHNISKSFINGILSYESKTR